MIIFQIINGGFTMDNRISINDILLSEMNSIFDKAKLRDNIFKEYYGKLKDKTLASLFLQPSTRTQLSFQSTIIGMLIIALVHNGSLKKKILITMMCFGVSCAIDMLAAFVLMDTPRSNNYVLFSSFLSVVIFYAFVVILKNIYRKRNREEFSGQWVFLCKIMFC